MKIGPLPPPAPVARPLPVAEPSQPFEDFLDTAYAFTELGMFGHGGAKAPEPGPGTCRGPAAAEPDPAPAPAALPEAGVESTDEPAMIPHARAMAARPVPAEVVRTAGNRAPSPARAKPQMPTGELPSSKPAPEEAEPDAGAPASGSARRPPPPRSNVSLIVSEKDGQVALVAAAPTLDPETRAALRRLVRDILAKSGLSLSHFQLNGAPLAADSLDTPGGFHGPRTR